MNTENSRNTIIFVVITGLILILYQLFVLEPQAQQRRAAQAEQAVAAAAGLPVGDDAPTAGAGLITDRAQALAASARVPIETPTLSGSLSLLGGRVDDLFLSNYRQTLDADSPPVELFRPQGMQHAFFAQFGWTAQNIPGGVPGPNTIWRLTAGERLTPQTPITLTWDNGQGLRFTREIGRAHV